MDQMQPGIEPIMTAPKSKVWLWVVIAVVVIVVAAFAWWWYAYQPAPEVTPPAAEAPASLTGGDTTADIEKDLGAVDLGNVEEELNQLDADINQL